MNTSDNREDVIPVGITSNFNLPDQSLSEQTVTDLIEEKSENDTSVLSNVSDLNIDHDLVDGSSDHIVESPQIDSMEDMSSGSMDQHAMENVTSVHMETTMDDGTQTVMLENMNGSMDHAMADGASESSSAQQHDAMEMVMATNVDMAMDHDMSSDMNSNMDHDSMGDGSMSDDSMHHGSMDHEMMNDIVIENNNAYMMAMGEGSRIEIHAADREKDSWSQLELTAKAGANTITIQDSAGWESGDKIAIASTSDDWQQAEEFTILDISDDGKTLTLDGELQFQHRGETLEYNNGQTGEDYREWDVDIRAEVALLSRNVTIQGDADSVEDGFGGHIMAMHGAEMHLEGAEFFQMGQESILGRYPIHWHMLGDAEGQYALNNSIHSSYQKGSTIHGTSNLLYEGNVVYDTVGHGVFLEDGSENHNHIYGNLVFSTQENDEGLPIPTDREHVSSFWIENANNYFIGNHAAGSESNGFWIIPQATPHGLSASTYVGDGSSLSDLTFISNTAHTNSGEGGAGGRDKALGIDGVLMNNLDFRAKTLDGDFGAVIQDFTAYEGAVWSATTEVAFSDSAFVDSRFFIRHENYVEDTLFAKENSGAAQVILYRDGGNQLNGVHLADGVLFRLMDSDHQNGADMFNNLTFDGSTSQNMMWWTAKNAVYQKTLIDVDGAFTGVPGTTLVPDTVLGAFKAPPGAEYSAAYKSWLTQHTVGATEVSLFDNDGDKIALTSAFRILRNDGESSDDHPTSKDQRSEGDRSNGNNDRSNATYEFNTATGMSQDVAYLLDVDLGDLSAEEPMHLTLNLTHVMEGQSAVYEIPGIANGFSANNGIEVSNLDALLTSSEAGYFADDASGSVFVRLVADDKEVYEDRPVDDLAADYRASSNITLEIIGQDILDHGNLELSTDLISAIDNQEPLDEAKLADVAEAKDANDFYIAYQQRLTEDQSTFDVLDTKAEGRFDVNFDVANKTVWVEGQFENLASDITMAHLHIGAEGQDGDSIVGLNISSSDARNGSFSGSAVLTDVQMDALLADEAYVNIQTNDHLGGELRGQIEMQEAGDFFINRPESGSETTLVTDEMSRWSNAATWSEKMPSEQDIVVINEGETVILDKSVMVKGIIVNGGELIIEDDAELTIDVATDYLLVINGGLFQAGTEENPLDTNFTLTLEGDDPDFDLEVSTILNGEYDNVVTPYISEASTRMDDTLLGSAGNDWFHGSHGDDVIDGGDGKDRLAGGRGDDYLIGGAGNDRLIGNHGNDTFEGGAGNDLMVGQTWRDNGHDDDVETAIYHGNMEDYDISIDLISSHNFANLEQRARLFIKDSEDGGADGINEGRDLLQGIDVLKFADQTVQVSDLIDQQGEDMRHIMVGRSENSDTIVSDSFDNVMHGKGGSDTFVFAGDIGHDTIVDFKAGQNSADLIDLISMDAFDSFEDVLGVATDDGQDTTIMFDNDNSIMLDDVLVTDLHEENFYFA